jgi:hypothetical protein
MLLDILFYFILMFCGPLKKEQTAALWKLYICQEFKILCHRNVNKQTNCLQVGNLIKNKSVAILEASRRILNTENVKAYVLANVKNY